MTRRVFIYLIIIALAAAGYFLQDKWLPQVQALWQAKFGTAQTAQPAQALPRCVDRRSRRSDVLRPLRLQGRAIL